MSDAVAATTIQHATAEDIPGVAELWCVAFPGKRTPAERARMLETGGRYGGLETVLVAREGGALVGACKAYQMTQYIAGVAMPMMGLAAVAVDPGARRQGLGARLCRRAMDEGRERGDVISTLYPFRPDYYERLGWGLVGALHEYRFATAALPVHDEDRHVRLAMSPADAEAIARCYDRVAARSNGPIERDARIWAYRLAGEDLGVRPVDPPGSAAPTRRDRVIVYDRDGIDGYALLRLLPGRQGDPREIRVRELVADSEDAYRGLIGHMAAMARQWPVARHAARVEERFGDRLADPRPPGGARTRSLYFRTARIIRGPMLRVLDVPRALAMRRYFEASPDRAPVVTTIEVAVADPQIPENDGPWTVRIESHGAVVDRAEGSHRGRGHADARIVTDAPTLARVFAGDLAPVDAVRLGRAECNGDVALLTAAFTTGERCWLLDEF